MACCRPQCRRPGHPGARGDGLTVERFYPKLVARIAAADREGARADDQGERRRQVDLLVGRDRRPVIGAGQGQLAAVSDADAAIRQGLKLDVSARAVVLGCGCDHHPGRAVGGSRA